jgi:sortase A
MSTADDNPLFQHVSPKKKVIQPIQGQTGRDTDNPAVNLIRDKIDHLYADEPSAKEELVEAEAAGKHRSKHQKFMHELSNSGKSLAEIQTAWHKYYQELPDKEKHEVWQEFYSEHSRVDQEIKQAKVHPQQQTAPPQQEAPKEAARLTHQAKKPVVPDLRTVTDVKNQIIRKVNSHAKSKNPHLQSVIFGLGVGALAVLIMLFGFFNERLIAPLVKPSKTVSSTSIISDPGTGASSKEPKIIIPKINVEIPVVYDNSSIAEADMQRALERGVVHYATTSNPGEKGNAVIFGHSSNNILNSGKYKFAFVLLNRMQTGDTFMLEKNGQRYIYKIFDKKVVPPTDLSVLDNISGKAATATLITCDPPGTALNRLVVVGEQISPSPTKNVASTAPQQTATPEAEILPSNSPSLWSRLTGWF